MQISALQTNYNVLLGANKVKDWTSTLTPLLAMPMEEEGTEVATALPTATPAPLAEQERRAARRMSTANSRKTEAATPAEEQQQQQQQQRATKKMKRAAFGNMENAVNIKKSLVAAIVEPKVLNGEAIVLAEPRPEPAAIERLTERIFEKLRDARAAHLGCSDVYTPADLIKNIAIGVLRGAANEPHGVRDCVVYFEFEDEPHNSRRIATLHGDEFEELAPTLEIYVTLRPVQRWYADMLKYLTRGKVSRISLSEHFALTKTKLLSSSNIITTTTATSASSKAANRSGSGSGRAHGSSAINIKNAANNRRMRMAAAAVGVTANGAANGVSGKALRIR